MDKPIPISRAVILLVFASAVIRGFLAFFLDLGNDEVYYWTYALYPDWSHFDHPPMVGWMIQLFTVNLHFQSEFFIRFSSIILGAVNTFLIYLIGKSLKDEMTGWYAALLYTSSVYSFIIAGTFILPDTPQLFYWLLSLYFLLEAFNPARNNTYKRFEMIMAGLAIGLAVLSKYTSVFLWLGAGLYIIIYDRSWLRQWSLFIAILLTSLIAFPVLLWNMNNDFISFTFHSGRVGFFGEGLNLTSFIRELSGQVLYNNPVNFILVVLAVLGLFKGKELLPAYSRRLLLLVSVPLILLFIFFSLFRDTLPHWTGPAYVTLSLVAAAYLRESSERLLPRSLLAAVSLLLALIIIGTVQIRTGWLYTDKTTEPSQKGSNDVSLDLFGWEQIAEQFEQLRGDDINRGIMNEKAPVFSYRWFPAANLDYYVATPAGSHVMAIGSLDRIHKYAWINQARGGFTYGMDGYFITTSRDFADPEKELGSYFKRIEAADTIPLMRGGKVAGYGFIYRLYDLTKIPEDPLTN